MNQGTEWYNGGIKELALKLDRHEKSLANAIYSLESKELIIAFKSKNKTRIKLNLTDDELYSRLAFISDEFCKHKSIQELKEDLENEIQRLVEEIENCDKLLTDKIEEDRVIESVIKQITSNDIKKLADRIVRIRTFSNINKTLEEIIVEELALFRSDMFSKYGNVIEKNSLEFKSNESKIYDIFWSND